MSYLYTNSCGSQAVYRQILDQELMSYHIAAHLVVVLVLLVGATFPMAPLYQIGSGWNLAGMFFT